MTTFVYEAKMHTKKPTQIEKFKQAARELECDESERGFEEKLKRITKPQDVTIDNESPD